MITPEEHIERAEQLIVEAEQDLAYRSELMVERGHAKATLALANIQIATAKSELSIC